ncbi:MAG: hypothetical protein EPO08_01770 [Rhodospirillaceae bacterium]|nr:MAG: hypothetical protein EPO08_01770 [Rhodospirillaceae bacterium]
MSDRPVPIPSIFFFVAVSDGDPAEASPLQGLAMSLCNSAGLLRSLVQMPSDIFEFSFDDKDAALARRITGTAPIWWLPLNADAIRHLPNDQVPFLRPEAPFVIILLGPDQKVSDYSEWRASVAIPPLIVASNGGDVRYEDFDLTAVQKHCLEICKSVGPQWPPEIQSKFIDAISAWRFQGGRALGYPIEGHNAFIPNQMALLAAGFDIESPGPFTPAMSDGDKPYIDVILATANSILDERERIGDRDMFRVTPPSPDINLFSPSMYPNTRLLAHLKSKRADLELTDWAAGIEALQSQTGYRIETSGKKFKSLLSIGKDSDKPILNPIITLRSKELSLNTAAAGLLAASEISAIVRLPNDINRIGGQVKQLAAQRRGSNPSDRKRLKTFKDMQQRLAKAVPKQFLDIIKRSKSGVRIISDAPLEWLDIEGLPLSLAKNVARVNSTPGNLFIGSIVGQQILHLRPEAFQEILIIGALKRTDPIRRLFEVAFESYDPILRDKVRLINVEVKSRAEFVDALNSFSGVFAVFDGHGSHAAEEAGKLWLQDESIDIWEMRNRVRVPPIVFLSACDTHATDINHATTANGFLFLGARTVIGSFLPLYAGEAAILVARLLHRVAEYIPGVIKAFDASTTWMDVMSGMLRMTLLTDFLRRLESQKLISHDDYIRINTNGNNAINWPQRDATEVFRNVLNEVGKIGVPTSQAEAEFRLAVATTSATSYVQLGRPESIIFDTEDRIRGQFKNH